MSLYLSGDSGALALPLSELLPSPSFPFPGLYCYEIRFNIWRIFAPFGACFPRNLSAKVRASVRRESLATRERIRKMNALNTPTGRHRINVIIEALEIAVNHYEFEADYKRAEELQLLIADMKAGN